MEIPLNKYKVLVRLDNLMSKPTITNWCLCIPSYTRPDFALGTYLTKGCSTEFIKEHVFVFVHVEELEAYKANYPLFNYVIVPEECYGLGRTRNYCYKWAKEQDYDMALNFDDDIKALEVLWEDTDAHGFATMRHTTKGDRVDFPYLTQYILNYYACCAWSLFNKYPSLRMGAIRRQHFCNNVPPEQFARINGGSTPRQTYAMRLADYTDDVWQIEESRWHGEDIIGAAHILKDRCEDMFSIQQITYDFVSESVSSTVRDTDENSPRNRKLHAEEWDNLTKLGLSDYVRKSKTYPDGSYMYGDIDWKAVKADGRITNFHKVKVEEMQELLNAQPTA